MADTDRETMPAEMTADTESELRRLRSELGAARRHLEQREQALICLNQRLLVLERNQAGIDAAAHASTAAMEARIAEIAAERDALRARVGGTVPLGEQALQEELQRLYSTKLFRYTRPARRVYAMLRRL